MKCLELADDEDDPVDESRGVHSGGDAEKLPSVAFQVTATADYCEGRDTRIC